MALNERLADSGFGRTVGVDIRRVKISEAALKIEIHHLAERVQINVVGLAVYDRQTHKTKSKFLHCVTSFLIRYGAIIDPRNRLQNSSVRFA